MTSYTLPIVGAHFRPPAKALLSVLPGGNALRIIPEPDNPHDENALAVFVVTSEIANDLNDELDVAASPFGYGIESIRDSVGWHLGYIPRTHAEVLQPRIVAYFAAQGKDGLIGILAFTPDGKPAIRFDLPNEA